MMAQWHSYLREYWYAVMTLIWEMSVAGNVWTLLWTAFILGQLFEYEEDKPHYVPKSKRGMWYRTKHCVMKAFISLWEMLDTTVQNWNTRPRNNLGGDQRKRTRWRHKKSLRAIAVMHAIAHSTQLKGTNAFATFDTDSGQVGIDNRCSACISNHIEDFDPTSLVQCRRAIKGFGGTRTGAVYKGTLNWDLEDDQGQRTSFRIPDSYFVPEGGMRLLSPQHWIQKLGSRTRAKEITTGKEVILQWGDSQKTIPLGQHDNVATTSLATGYTKFKVYAAALGDKMGTDEDPILCQTTVVSDDEDDEPPVDMPHRRRWVLDREPEQVPAAPNWVDWSGTTPGTVPEKAPNVIEDEEDRMTDNKAADFLRWHHKYNHLSFEKLKIMAKQGVIPSRLANCPTPVCTACSYAKIKKRAWRAKTRKNFPSETPKEPGHVVSVDQLTSSTKGFIAQMTGRLTKARYEHATVFVDQASRLGYVYLQRTTSAEETIKAKIAFEQYARERGVIIRGYHADNGVFRAHKWVADCTSKNQALTFAGVGAHHANGVAERRIQEIQNTARTMLTHSQHRWPAAVNAHLWPYAVRAASEAFNSAPLMQDPMKRTPQQLFSGTDVHINSKYQMPFGCPVYVLDAALQNTKSKIFDKWKDRSRVGVYLGRSPSHAHNVALVLSLETGLVSPQFHVKFDPSFHSVKHGLPLESKWQLKAGFRPPPKETDLKKRARASEGATFQASKKRQTHPGVTFDAQMDQPPRGEGHEEPTVAPVAATTEIFCLEALYPEVEDELQELVACKASADPDTMYYHEAMRQPDRKEFLQAMLKEVADQMGNGNFELISRDKVLEGEKVLPMVWQMKRKRDIRTRAIKKYKARLNVDGSRMEQGKHYDKSYAPVVRWSSIRLLLILAACLNWHTSQIDYVQAFPQAPAERELYLKIPAGFEVEGGDNSKYVLVMKKNVYGQKQAGRAFNTFLDKRLKGIGFKPSKVDDCVYWKGSVMYVLYTDDSILAGPSRELVDQAIKDIKGAGLDITEEGDIQDFLGVNINRKEDGTISLTQPHLIDQIINDLRLQGAGMKDCPAQKKILGRYAESQPHDSSFNYRSVLGQLGYLEKGSRPDIAYITHQCARFSIDPKVEHARALRYLGKYLVGTKDKGLILKPDRSKGLEVFVDADFCGNWSKEESDDRDTARSRYGYVIKYMGCPLVYKSQLSQEIALSTTESEYMGLSQALREAIPIMELLKELKEAGFPVGSNVPEVKCKVFEDNSGALEIAKEHKYRPRTKHINVKYHHFRDYVDRGDISIVKIGTEDQEADILTKPLIGDQFLKLRKLLMGW